MSALPVVAANPNPHFQRLGGEAAVARLVDAFYRAMDQRDDARAIRAMHDADLAQTKAVLRIYLAEWLGGPKRYTAFAKVADHLKNTDTDSTHRSP